MAVMYSFCRYFSVRLGSILVAASSIIQSLGLLGFTFLCLHDIEQTHEDFTELISEYDFFYLKEPLTFITASIGLLLKTTVVFLLIHISTCILLVYASVKCNIPLIWPFLAVEFFRLGLLFTFHVLAMVFIKNNSIDLGLLVGLCLLGSFILLGLYYMWFCVFSLCQCIRELKQRESTQTKNKLKNKNSPAGKPQRFKLYSSDFKQVSENKGQLTELQVQTVQNIFNQRYPHRSWFSQ